MADGTRNSGRVPNTIANILRFELKRELATRESICRLQLDTLVAVNKPVMLAGKKWILGRIPRLEKLETIRDFTIFASFWFLFSGLLTACLLAVPLGVLAGTSTCFFQSAPVSLVWIAATFLVFSAFKKTCLPDLSWTWILLTGMVAIAGAVAVGRIREAQWDRELWEKFWIFAAKVEYPHVLAYYLLLSASLLANLFPILAWPRLQMRKQVKIALLFLIPPVVYCTLLSAADSAGWGSPGLRLFLWGCGKALAAAVGGFLLSVLGGIWLLYNRFESYRRRKHPDLVIIANLLNAILILEPHGPKVKLGDPQYEWDEFAGRRQVADRLERIAACVEVDLAGILATEKNHTQSETRSQFRRMACHFRGLKLWAVFPKADTRGYLLEHLEGLLRNMVMGNWDGVPRVAEEELPPGKTPWKMAGSLAVGFSPLAFFLIAWFLNSSGQPIPPWADPESQKWAVPLSLGWAFVSLSLTFDNLLGEKIAVFTSILDIFRKPRGA